MKILTRINERSWCEQFIRLRRFIFSKATIINIFWHQNGITRRKYIYIYIKRFLSKYFSRWSMYLIHFRSPFSSFICHSLSSFFPSSFVSPFASISQPLSVHFFRKFRVCIISQCRKVSMIREWNTKPTANRLNFLLVSTNVIFLLVRKIWQYLFLSRVNFYPKISTLRWSSFNNNNAYIFFLRSETLWKQISPLNFPNFPPPCTKININL